ncbi:transposase [Streptomyces prasinus]|uniref:transposase n=1 Tax=Streptomyces prasinus TaxID=67345 RepID=UPI003693C2A6
MRRSPSERSRAAAGLTLGVGRSVNENSTAGCPMRHDGVIDALARPGIERRVGKDPRGCRRHGPYPVPGPTGGHAAAAPPRCAVPLPASRTPRGRLFRCLLDPAGALRRVVEGALPRFRAVSGKSSTSKRYTAELRRDAVAPVRSSGKTVPGGAREAGVSPEGLRNRVSQDKAARGRGGPSASTSSAWACRALVGSHGRWITPARSPGTVRI